MTEQFQQIQEMITKMMSDVVAGFISFTPKLIGALLVLLVGWLLARVIQVVVERAIRVGLGSLLERTGITQALERASMTAAPSTIVGRLLYWLILLGFVMGASEIIGLTAVTAAITRIFSYIPSVISAALVLAAGVLLSRVVGNLVGSAGEAANLTYAKGLAAVTRGAIVVMVGVVTVEQLGVDAQILVTVITVGVASLTAGMALSFALGSREVVRGILAGHYLRQSLDDGVEMEVAGERGTVDRIGPVYTVFRDGERSWRVPNSRLIRELIRS